MRRLNNMFVKCKNNLFPQKRNADCAYNNPAGGTRSAVLICNITMNAATSNVR